MSDAMKNRRSCYAIGKNVTMKKEEIIDILKEAITHCPSAFNSQTSRVILLLGDKHLRLWEITKNTLKAVVPAGAFAETEEKLNSFAAGYGTILFYEDENPVKELQKTFPRYKDNFPRWSEQSAGMLQFAVWTLIQDHGLASSLQHYNPLIDAEVRKEFSVPESWNLIAQMPFGSMEGKPQEKEFSPIDKRLFIYE